MPGKQFRDPSLLKRPWIKSLFVEVATGSDVSRLTPEEFRLEVTNGPGRVLHCQVLTVVPDEGRVLLFDGQHTMWAKLSEECKNTMDPDTLGYRFETLAGKIVIPKKFWFCIRISGSDNDLQLMIERLLVWGSDVLVEMEAPSPIEEDPEIRDILGGLGLTKLVRGTATVLAPLQALENRFRGKIDNYWTERYHRTMGIGTAKTDEPFHSADQNPSFDGNRAALELVAMSSSGSEQNGDVTEDNGEPIDVEDLGMNDTPQQVRVCLQFFVLINLLLKQSPRIQSWRPNTLLEDPWSKMRDKRRMMRLPKPKLRKIFDKKLKKSTSRRLKWRLRLLRYQLNVIKGNLQAQRRGRKLRTIE